MRFNEFRIVEDTQPGFYAVGDSHAEGISSSSSGWKNLGKKGLKSTDFSMSTLNNIPPGSTIALSLGHNDATGTNDSPEQIANRVSSIVDRALADKLKVYFVLFPTGNVKETAERNEAVRIAIYNQVRSKVSAVYDLNRGQSAADKIHASSSTYAALGNFITGSNISSASSATIKSGKGATVSPSQVSSYLKTKGLDDNHVAGILANISGESGFRAGVLGDNNTSGGLFQHHAGRFANMVKYVGDDWRTDWQGQVDFALSEPAGQQYVRTRFARPQDASKWWTIHFEVPANKYVVAQSRAASLGNIA